VTPDAAPAAATVGEAVAGARELLAAAGLADPRREADELYAALVCGPVSAAWTARADPIPAAVHERLRTAAARRAAGWPQAYAAGRANFLGHWLSVDQRVLIPRPETEGLVEVVLRQVAARAGGTPATAAPGDVRAPSEPAPLPLVADIGTGSGAIAIALALAPGIGGVIATDMSSEALSLAMENAAALGVKERVSFRRGPYAVPLLDDRVDVIVSNPPYIATAEWEQLDPGVRDFEPRLALEAGPEGMDAYRTLVPQAFESLNPGGLLALEVDERRAQEVAALALAAGFADVRVRPDLADRPRYVTARRP